MGITLIDKTKPPAPKWVHEPIPEHFKTEVHREKYHEMWHQRFLEGHAGLTGPHIMALQHNHLKIIDGSIIRPTWREADEKYFFDPVAQARKDKNALLIIKRREFGLTSWATWLAHYFARMNKGITNNITSDSQGHLSKMFFDKILITQDYFHPDLRGSYDSREGGSISKTKQKVGMTLAMKSFNDYKEIVTKTSDFYLNESSESELAVSKFSSTRAHYTFVDEAALHKRVLDLIAALQPVMMKGTETLGFLLMGGSVEKSVSQAALVRLKSLIDNRLAFNMQYTFIPGYAALEQFTVNGYTDEKKGLEWILQRREYLEKHDNTPDKKMLTSFIKSHPLDEKELFDLGGEGFWEEDSLKILNQVKDDLGKINIPIKPVELVRLGDNIKVNVVSKSPVTIFEDPKERTNYLIGFDSIMSGTEAGEEDGSEVAALVMKQLDMDDPESSYTPVALYHERPKRLVGGAYNTLVSLANYYNMYGANDKLFGTNNNTMRCKIFPEANAATSEHLITFLEAEGMKHFLKHRPDLSGKGNTNTKKFGVHVTVDVLDWQTKQANLFIQKYGYRFKMKEVIEALILLGATNSDIGSAFLAALVGMGSKFDQPAKLPPPPPSRWKTVIKFDSEGRSYYDNIEIKQRPTLPDDTAEDKTKYVTFMGIRSPTRPPSTDQ